MQPSLDQAYLEYYPLLYSLCAKIVGIHEEREEIIHNVFVKLYQQPDFVADVSLKAYLCKAVVNLSLNWAQRQQNLLQHHKKILMESEEVFYHMAVDRKEKIQQVRQEIEKLPDQCKLVFKLSRYEELSQQEIADRLNISIKTVKNHIGKALKTLEENLRESAYFSNGLLFLITLKIFLQSIGLILLCFVL